MTTYPHSWSPGYVGANEQSPLSPQDLLGTVDERASSAADPVQAGRAGEATETPGVGGAGAASRGGRSPVSPEHWAVDGDVEPFAADVALTPVADSAALTKPGEQPAPAPVEAEPPPQAPERGARLLPVPGWRAVRAFAGRCRAWAPEVLAPALLLVNTGLLAAALASLCLGVARPAAPHRARELAAPGRPPAGAYGKEPGPTLELPEIIVHLRDGAQGPVRRTPDGRGGHFAWVTLELQLPDDAAKQAASVQLPRIRDALLAYLSDRTALDLRGGQAFRAVKSGLAHSLSEAAPDVPVRDLYVTRFVFR